MNNFFFISGKTENVVDLDDVKNMKQKDVKHVSYRTLDAPRKSLCVSISKKNS